LGASNSWRIYPEGENVYTFSISRKGRDFKLMTDFGWQEMFGLLASGAMGSLLTLGFQRWLKK
jgi:hypothetical protein